MDGAAAVGTTPVVSFPIRELRLFADDGLTKRASSLFTSTVHFCWVAQGEKCPPAWVDRSSNPNPWGLSVSDQEGVAAARIVRAKKLALGKRLNNFPRRPQRDTAPFYRGLTI
jgi:hypothetical protein